MTTGEAPRAVDTARRRPHSTHRHWVMTNPHWVMTNPKTLRLIKQRGMLLKTPAAPT